MNSKKAFAGKGARQSTQATSSPYQYTPSKNRAAGPGGISSNRAMGVHPPLAPAVSLYREDEDDIYFDEMGIERLTPTSPYRRARAASEGADFVELGEYPDEYEEYEGYSEPYANYGGYPQNKAFEVNWQETFQGGWNSLGSRLSTARETVQGTVQEVQRRRKRSKRDRFHWREREWGSRLWVERVRLLPGLMITVVLVVVVTLFAFVIAIKAANKAALPSTPPRASTVNPIVIQQNVGSGSPTPDLPAYTVGVWVSDMSPAASGSIQVFVRVSQNTNFVNAPVAGVTVTISAPYGSTTGTGKTDASGVATFTFNYSAPPGSPVDVTATALVNGQSITSDIVFVAG